MTERIGDGASSHAASALPASRHRRRPVQERSSTTFARIEAAAIRLLSRGVPLTDMTTLQISREAGVSIGGLYRFFPDKQAIVDAIAVNNVTMFEQRISADIQGTPRFDTAADFISYVIDVFVAHLDAHPEFRTILYGGGHLSQNIRLHHFGYDAPSAQLVRRYALDTLGVADSPEFALRWRIVGEISGALIGLAMEQDALGHRDEVLRQAKHLITGYLFSPTI